MEKGVISSQVAWIFILFAGFFILILSLKIVAIHQSLSDQKLSLSVASNLKRHIKTSATSKDTKFVIQTFGGTVHNSCSGFVINGRQTLSTPVFSSQSVSSESGKWIVFTQPFNFPTHLNNFIMLIAPTDKFVFVYDSSNQTQKDIVDSIKDDLPTQQDFEMPVYTTNKSSLLSALSYANSVRNSRIRIIYLKQNTPTSFNNNKISLYWIQPISKDGSFGNVTFYTYEDKKLIRGILPYFDIHFLPAYICSDYTIAKCNLAKYLKDAYYKLEIEDNTMILLENTNSYGKSCPTLMNDFVSKIMYDFLNDLKTIGALNYSNSDVLIKKLLQSKEKIHSDEQRVSSQNEALMVHSCPTMY